MSEWKKVKLGDYIDVLSGFAYKSKDFSDSGIPVIKIKNVCPPYISLEDLSYVPNSIAFQNPRYILKKGDVLIAMTGSHINQIASVVGRVGRVRYDDVTVLNQRVGKIVNKDDSLSCLDFIYYYLSQYEVKVELAQKAGGAANQANISPSDIKNLMIPCPPLEVQNRIATILSRYDSLIENYQNQIKLLEEAAQRLYKEWFVDLHFPGHENTKVIDGVPEGWEKKKLIEFGCTLESGSRPKGGVDSNLKDGIPSVGAENVIGLGKYNYSSEKLITNQFYSQMRKGKIKNRDILIYKDGAYIGRTSLFQDGFPHKEMAVNEHVFLLHTLNENYQYYVFFTLYQKQYFEKMQKLNKNAAQPGLNQKALLDLGMLCPSEEFVMTFRKAIEPLMKALFNKANQIRLLTEARDRLLPKLMNGEIEV